MTDNRPAAARSQELADWLEELVETESRRQDGTDSGATLEELIKRVLATPAGRVPQIEEAAAEVRRRDLQRIEDQLVARDPAVVLIGDQHRVEPWYRGVRPKDKFWPAYRRQLEEWDDLPEEAIRALHESSDAVLRNIADPRTDRFEVRGLVLGYVQSGKTANFNAVICKAADRGYRLIVVLSGVHNNLRSQTQARIDDDVVAAHLGDWHLLTGDTDFKATDNAANIVSTNLAIAVAKKNASVLTKLNDWLDQAGPELDRCPILLVDDECDQASVNTGTGETASTINGLVRRIADRTRVSYVGYTATPYANFFSDPDPEENTLYPRNFIINLPRPSAYFGAEQIFGREEVDEDDQPVGGLDVINLVKPELIPQLLPPTNQADRVVWQPNPSGPLEDAIAYFVMATAARWTRGQRHRHSSMLIHITSSTEIMDRFYEPLGEVLGSIRRRVESDDLEALREQWERESGRGVCEAVGRGPTDFEAIVPLLTEVLDEARVVVDHYKSDHRLKYTENEPVVVIAIGGNTLSRGLTLEGLTVSLFMRNSTTYDTLMQMGRWFGYRSGYEDLPRIWTSSTLRDNFKALALVEEEIRRDINNYATDGTTPLDMAVRVRTHHTMRITSPLKGGVAEDVQITLTDSEHSTIHFDPDIKAMKSNLAAVTELISHHEPTAGDPGAYSGYLYREVPADHVRRFLDSYRVPPNTSFDPALMVDYLARELAIGRLGEWNIFIPNGPGGPFALPGGRAVGLTRRSRLIEDPENPQRINIGALVAPPHRIVDLRPEAVANTLSGRSKEAVIRERRNEPPLLIVYPIDKASAPPDRLGRKVRDRLGVDHDLIGMAIRFPTASTPNAVTYRAVPLDEPTYVYSDGGFEGGAP